MVFLPHNDVIDVSTSPGMAHLRHWLRQDVSYQWDAKLAATAAPPYVLTFRDGEQFAQFLLDIECKNMWQGIDGPRVRLSERMSSGLQTFIEERFGANQELHRRLRLRKNAANVPDRRADD
jgi:hypothetical protein